MLYYLLDKTCKINDYAKSCGCTINNHQSTMDTVWYGRYKRLQSGSNRDWIYGASFFGLESFLFAPAAAYITASTGRWHSVSLVLVHRLRRWTSIKLTLVFAGIRVIRSFFPNKPLQNGRNGNRGWFLAILPCFFPCEMFWSAHHHRLYPTKTCRRPNVVLMLDKRRIRWTNIKTSLAQWLPGIVHQQRESLWQAHLFRNAIEGRNGHNRGSG